MRLEHDDAEALGVSARNGIAIMLYSVEIEGAATVVNADRARGRRLPHAKRMRENLAGARIEKAAEKDSRPCAGRSESRRGFGRYNRAIIRQIVWRWFPFDENYRLLIGIRQENQIAGIENPGVGR